MMPVDGNSDEAAGGEGVPPVLPVSCWRCGQMVVPMDGKCPRCDAVVRSMPGDDQRPATQSGSSAVGSAGESLGIVRMLIVYGAILLVVIVSGAVIRQCFTARELKAPSEATIRTLLTHLTVVEVILSAIVIFGLFWVPRPVPLRRPRRTLAWGAWVVSAPVLALALLANVGYHTWLRDSLGLPTVENVLIAESPSFLLLVLLFCVQPAIIEELMFRFLFLGSIKPVTGTHTAVWISALAFGLAHLASPLSVPILIVMGIVLGYARVATGGLWLPMLLHFTHNLVVIWQEM